jgi:hypothetical protein
MIHARGMPRDAVGFEVKVGRVAESGASATRVDAVRNDSAMPISPGKQEGTR